MFNLGFLTRDPSGASVDDVHFAVVDVETTGLDAGSDRIVEVAVTRMTGDGSMLGTASTLVNPESLPIPAEASQIHRIYPRDVADAPTFGQIAPDLLHLLDDAIVVTHNLVFDGAFLTAEFRRAGITVPAMPALCTQVTALSQLMDTRVRLPTLTTLMLRRRLGKAAHSAAVDSRCTAALLHQFLNNAPATLRYVGTVPTPAADRAFAAPQRFRPAAGRQPQWPDLWWQQGNANGAPRWHQHWQGRETAAQTTLEWREAVEVPGIEVVAPPAVEHSREQILTRRARQVQAMGSLGDYTPDQRGEMAERTLARIRSFGKLAPERQAELREAFTARLAVNGGDLAEAFDRVKEQSMNRVLCPRDAKMHRIGIPCNTLDWPDGELWEYLREQLDDMETDTSRFAEMMYRHRESRGILRPSPAEQQAAQAEHENRATVIRAALTACEARISDRRARL
ncbi:exonuclease domain-containing protein [Streptomyces sp. NPDC091209]|uniref:3'-5' exonuclease n=1 Tax=Streptomyces sp. NPDC091209 TaxID=3365974 RepID=UPI0038242822